MRNKQLLRYSLASLSVMGAAFGVFLIACGDDDNVTPTPQEAGTGNDTGTTNPPDGGGGGQDAEAGAPAKPNAKLQLVNAATDFGPSNPSGALRVCYGVGPNEAQAIIAPLPPLPDQKSSAAAPFPGVFIGTGGAVQGTGTDLATLAVVPYVMNAQTLSAKGLLKPGPGMPGIPCSDILGNADAGNNATPGVDYWKLPAIPSGTFLKEKSYILVLTGCAGDSTSGAALCGTGFTPGGGAGNGNLKVTVYELDNTTAVAADKIGTEFIHASPQADSFLGAVPVNPGYIANDLDAGTFKGVVANDAGNNTADSGVDVPLYSKTKLAQITGVNFASDRFTPNPNLPAVQQPAYPLPVIQALSYGATVPDGGTYRNGASFTFIAIGDPLLDRDAGGTFNTKTFHFIALPNDPVSETYKP